MKNRKFLLRILSLCMALVLTCSLFPPCDVQAEILNSAEKQKKNGKTIEKMEMTQEVIEINTSEDFLAFAENCSLDVWSANKRVILNNDIDLSNVLFEVVPVFMGIFDGQNHTISGFQYRGDGYVAGLFRYIKKNGCVENLKLKGEVIAVDENECIGGLCGVNYGTIRNCSFQGTVSGNTTVGGLVGVNEGTGIIRNSSAKGRVTGYYSTGGLVGRNHGTVNNCINRACINNNNEWVEEADEMGVGLFLHINITDSDMKLFSGVDSGGIAGCSDGIVIKCINYGEIGYEHMGYNIGGIVGRQSGVVSLCTNNGVVYGRKDVGGIVGQMEPYIEVDEAETLRNAVGKLHDLIEKTVEDMGDGKNTVKKDLDAMTVYSDGAVDAGDALAGQIVDLIDDTIDQAQAAADRLDHVMDMLSDIFDNAASAEKSFSKAIRSLSQIGNHLEDLGNSLGVIDDGLDVSLDKLGEAQQRVEVIIQEIQNNPDVSVEDLKELQKAMEELSDTAAAVINNLNTAISGASQQAADSLQAVENNMKKLAEAQQRLRAIIQEIQKNSDAKVEDLKELQKVMEELSDAVAAVIKSLNTAGQQAADSMKAVENDMKKLTEAQQHVKDIIQEILKNPDTSKEKLKELQKALTELSDAAATVIKSLNTAIGDMRQQTEDSLKVVENDMKKLAEAQQHMKDIIQKIQKSPDISADRLKELQKVLTELSDAAVDVINSLNTAAGNVSQQTADILKSVENDMKTLSEAQQRLKTIIQEIQNSPDISADRLKELQKALAELSDAAADVINSLNTTVGNVGQQTADSLKAVGNDMKKAMEYLQQALDSIKSATKDTKSIVDYVNGQENIHFSKLGNTFDINRENLRAQLYKMSGCIKSLGDDASSYSDVINEDLKAINDQINIIFNLLADNLTNYEKVSMEEVYEDVDIEDTDNITVGKTDNCVNKGIVKGDINVGGVAGAMSIDEEDLEDSAAGSVDYQIGKKIFTECLITNCINEGYVTAKKDGAGGIVGYMRHGIVVDSEGYGSVESTEGNYVGGICGESFTVIRRCYALCSVSGGKNIGGIAGFADTLKDCYAITDCSGTFGRIGAIAGQTVNYDDALNEDEVKVSGNYYVDSKLYGIDNISYVGVAEPISYEELLKAENLPVQFRHLKVIFKVDDLYLGTQEVPYGESLSELKYPPIPEKEGYYGVWPDYSDRIMEGNLLIAGEYKENITVVQSNGMQIRESGKDDDGQQEREKPYALVEQRFTEDTVLKVSTSNAPPPEQVRSQEHVIYDVTLEQVEISDTDTFAIRLYNPYDQAVVWSCKNGIWTELESKVRGGYLQVDMTGTEEMFCVAEEDSSKIWMMLGFIVGGVTMLALLFLAVKKRRHH